MSTPEADPVRGAVRAVYERAAEAFRLRDTSSYTSSDLQPYRDEIIKMNHETNEST